MKITAVETVQLPAHPRHLWVLVHTDEGLTGIGEPSTGFVPKSYWGKTRWKMKNCGP